MLHVTQTEDEHRPGMERRFTPGVLVITLHLIVPNSTDH